MKQPKPGMRAAYCGILTALSVVFMLLVPIVPVMLYCAPVLAGICAAIAAEEFGTPYSLAVYISSSILSLLLVADKEAVLVYILLAGAYAVLKYALGDKHKQLVRLLIKLAFIAFGVLAYYLIAVYLLGIPKDSFGSPVVRAAFLIIGAVLMLIYDKAIDNIILIYKHKLRKRFMHKL